MMNESDRQDQRKGTMKDYFNRMNGFGIPYNNPQVRFNPSTDVAGVLNFEDPELKAVYEGASLEAQRGMLNARNNSDALKIAERNVIFEDSGKAIEQDGLATQLAMGVIPALASPTSLIPAGALIKGAQLAKRTHNIINYAAGGAIGGAVAGIAEEALFDANGLPTHYLAAGGFGAMFGGGLGMLGGALSGPYSKSIANGLDPAQDTFTKDFAKDPIVTTVIDEHGNVQVQDIAAMDKSIIDKIPFLGSILKSDIHTLFQSDVPVMRGLAARIQVASVSSRDAAGNLLPIKMTGIDKKRSLLGYHNNLTAETKFAYHDARKTGYAGTSDEFDTEVYKIYMDELTAQHRAATAHAHHQLDHLDHTTVEYRKAKIEVMDKWYDDNPAVFKGDDYTNKGAEAYRKYYDGMLAEGHGLDVQGLRSVKKNRLYAPRVYDYKALHAGKVSSEDAIMQLKNALINDPRNRHLNTDELLTETADGLYKHLMDTAFDMNNLTSSFLVKDLPFGTHLRARKLYLDETQMPDLLRTDFESVTGAYHYKMSGRLSTQFAFGTEDLKSIMHSVREEHHKLGIMENKKEVQALENSIKDLLGDLRINGLSDSTGWVFTRNLLTYNSTRMGGGFGVNQLVELAGAVMLNGVKAIMSGRLKTSLKQSARLLYTNNRDIDEFSKYLISSGYLSDALKVSRINRFSDSEAGFNSGWLENKLNGLQDKLMKYNGMRYFMGVMEDYTGGAIITKLKAGDIRPEQIARWGLTPAEAKTLGTRLKDVTGPTGKDWDLSKLTQLEQDKLQLAITRGIDEIVIQGDSIHLPTWLKTPDPFKKVLFQFIRFPLIAQEVLTRRGIKEDQAAMVAAVFGSSMMYMGFNSMREQASIALGIKSKADEEWNLEDPAQFNKAVLKSLNYNAPFGFMSSVYNYGAIATGNNELGRDWSSKHGMPSLVGPSGGLVEDLIQLMRAGIAGDLDTERNLQRFKSLTPFMNLPLINEGGKMLVEEVGR